MRASLCALAISSALIAAVALSPAVAQNIAPAQSTAPAKGTDSIVPEHDVKEVLSEVILAWHNFNPCDHTKLCAESFESYGVAITFNDGTIVPFSHVQRLRISAHDCIVLAREALGRGDRGMAVQWVMASYLREDAFRNWLADHPDAVIAALQRCCY